MVLEVNDLVFFGRSLETFQDLLLEQANEVFEKTGIIVPVRSCSLLLGVSAMENASASDLSQLLDCSHQLVLQKIPKLKKLGLISVHQDVHDARRRVFALTKKGSQQVEKLEQVLPAFADAYKVLFDEVGDLPGLIADASEALKKTPLSKRIDL